MAKFDIWNDYTQSFYLTKIPYTNWLPTSNKSIPLQTLHFTEFIITLLQPIMGGNPVRECVLTQTHLQLAGGVYDASLITEGGN